MNIFKVLKLQMFKYVIKIKDRYNFKKCKNKVFELLINLLFLKLVPKVRTF